MLVAGDVDASQDREVAAPQPGPQGEGDDGLRSLAAGVGPQGPAPRGDAGRLVERVRGDPQVGVVGGPGPGDVVRSVEQELRDLVEAGTVGRAAAGGHGRAVLRQEPVDAGPVEHRLAGQVDALHRAVGRELADSAGAIRDPVLGDGPRRDRQGVDDGLAGEGRGGQPGPLVAAVGPCPCDAGGEGLGLLHRVHRTHPARRGAAARDAPDPDAPRPAGWRGVGQAEVSRTGRPARTAGAVRWRGTTGAVRVVRVEGTGVGRRRKPRVLFTGRNLQGGPDTGM